ncbi:MAG: hypothetical protein CL928_18200 [Deltaproteobacteria bacterium]|nr:hypothetical protein [Deltaproteobacteria bacterium]
MAWIARCLSVLFVVLMMGCPNGVGMPRTDGRSGGGGSSDDGAGDDGSGADDGDDGDDDDASGDGQDGDRDGDTISDAEEGDGDPDGDGIPNDEDSDSDGDGIPDSVEAGDSDPTTEAVDSDGDGTPDFLDDDSDGDGIADADEAGDDPTQPDDSDGDGTPDFQDEDSDNDGTPDGEELEGGTDPSNDDSDGDGFTDLVETLAGTDPNDPTDFITGFYAELTPRTSTTLQVPFTPEIEQADVLFMLDTTCSMALTLNTMASNFSSIVSTISIPNIAYGVATFDDYATGDFGVLGEDLPFELVQQITTDTTAVQSALSTVSLHDGNDGPESSMEALYQAATGVGHDLNCSGSYDFGTDVWPFMASPSDAFGGTEAGVYDAGTPGGGTIGGVGFRAGSVPIIAYATDAQMRDPDNGFDVPSACPTPPGESAVAAALNAIGAKLIGIETPLISIPIFGSDIVGQMEDLASLTGSEADLNGNGSLEPLVFTGSGSSTVNNIISGIGGLAGGGVFDLTLEVDDDPYDFVTEVNPSVVSNAPLGVEVVFDLTLYPDVPIGSSDQVFVFDMSVVGDGITTLATWQLVILVTAG